MAKRGIRIFDVVNTFPKNGDAEPSATRVGGGGRNAISTDDHRQSPIGEIENKKNRHCFNFPVLMWSTHRLTTLLAFLHKCMHQMSVRPSNVSHPTSYVRLPNPSLLSPPPLLADVCLFLSPPNHCPASVYDRRVCCAAGSVVCTSTRAGCDAAGARSLAWPFGGRRRCLVS